MPIFAQVTLGLILATTVGLVALVFRQPLILAYIVAGVVLSIFGFGQFGDLEALRVLGSFGVAFLLFLVGLELRISNLAYIGKSALLTGLGQLFFTAIFGWLIANALGFSLVVALYIAVALTFSSTIIVVKLLGEKNDLDSLYGRIAVGFLLVQDFAAILALIFLAGFAGGSNVSTITFLVIFVKGAALAAGAFILNRWILPKLFEYIAHSGELLFISAISWAFIFASFAQVLGLSLEIGAFLAGIALASSPFHLQIAARIKPLRDFFIVIFFIVLGLSMEITDIGSQIVPAAVFSMFVLIGNPLIVLAIMGFLGHKKRTSFLAAITVAQISEFSFIVAAAGLRAGHLTSEVVSLITLVGLITIGISSYMILHGNRLYLRLGRFLDVFERKEVKEKRIEPKHLPSHHIILVGCDRMGSDILHFLRSKDESFVVVDFNPEITQKLTADKVEVVFGDISDPEIAEDLNLQQAKLIISTVPDAEDNLILVTTARKAGFGKLLVATASTWQEAAALYEAGADYVVLPAVVGGRHIARILADHWENLTGFAAARNKHLADLLERTRPKLSRGR